VTTYQTQTPIIVGIFQEEMPAKNAVDALRKMGFAQEQIGVAMHGGAPVDHLAQDFMQLGVTNEAARYYEKEFDAGHIVVSVRHDGRMGEASQVLRSNGGYDYQQAGQIQTDEPHLNARMHEQQQQPPLTAQQAQSQQPMTTQRSGIQQQQPNQGNWQTSQQPINSQQKQASWQQPQTNQQVGQQPLTSRQAGLDAEQQNQGDWQNKGDWQRAAVSSEADQPDLRKGEPWEDATLTEEQKNARRASQLTEQQKEARRASNRSVLEEDDKNKSGPPPYMQQPGSQENQRNY